MTDAGVFDKSAPTGRRWCTSPDHHEWLHMLLDRAKADLASAYAAMAAPRKAERPESFEGVITIEWANPPEGAPLAGWRFLPRLLDGSPVSTVLEMTLHIAAESGVWAECLMLADRDGRPAPAGLTAWTEDGEPLKGTFAYEVAAMTAVQP